MKMDRVYCFTFLFDKLKDILDILTKESTLRAQNMS